MDNPLLNTCVPRLKSPRQPAKYSLSKQNFYQVLDQLRRCLIKLIVRREPGMETHDPAGLFGSWNCRIQIKRFLPVRFGQLACHEGYTTAHPIKPRLTGQGMPPSKSAPASV